MIAKSQIKIVFTKYKVKIKSLNKKESEKMLYSKIKSNKNESLNFKIFNNKIRFPKIKNSELRKLAVLTLQNKIFKFRN